MRPLIGSTAASDPTAMVWVVIIGVGLYIIDKTAGRRAITLVLFVVAAALVVRVASAAPGVGSP